MTWGWTSGWLEDSLRHWQLWLALWAAEVLAAGGVIVRFAVILRFAAHAGSA